jgi:hypothetical protein
MYNVLASALTVTTAQQLAAIAGHGLTLAPVILTKIEELLSGSSLQRFVLFVLRHQPTHSCLRA